MSDTTDPQSSPIETEFPEIVHVDQEHEHDEEELLELPPPSPSKLPPSRLPIPKPSRLPILRKSPSLSGQPASQLRPQISRERLPPASPGRQLLKRSSSSRLSSQSSPSDQGGKHITTSAIPSLHYYAMQP